MRQMVCAIAAAMALSATIAFAQAAKPMPAKPMAKSMNADKLMANENKLLDAVRAKDAKTFSSLVKAGSWSIDENGLMPVDDFVKALGDPKADVKIEMLRASDMKVIDIDANAAIVAYTTEQKGSFMGMSLPPKTYVTTIWANRGGTWHAVFHQESTAAPAAKK
jgi:hypothetical protein